MQNSEQNELQQALRKHLSRTTAPDTLWARIHTSSARSAAAAKRATPWLLWATATAALVVAAGSGFMAWRMYEPSLSVEAMAVDAISKGPEHLALKTSSASEIRTWVKSQSNLDIPLPGMLRSKEIEILGANMLTNKLHGNEQVAEVSYKIGNYQAALLISKDPTGARTYPNHLAQTITPESGARITSWSMRGQNYTLAWGAPGEFKTACLLCHTGSDRALN